MLDRTSLTSSPDLDHALPRHPQSRTARSGPAHQRAAADSRRRGLRQDARHHQPHRLPGRRRPRAAATKCSRSRSRTRPRKRCARGSRRCSAPTAAGMWVSTFHSLCARLLRREAPAIGLSRDFVIYDSSDQLTVVKQAMKELHIDDSFVQPRAALSRISHAKNRMEAPGGRRGRGRLEPPRRADREGLRLLPERAEGEQRARLRRSAAQDGGAVRAVGAGPRRSTPSSSGS